MSQQPYAPPGDDGGGQGSFTKPGDALAQPNPADPLDRAAAGSFYKGVEEDVKTTDPIVRGVAQTWLPFRDVWKAQAMILLMVLLFAAAALGGNLLSAH